MRQPIVNNADNFFRTYSTLRLIKNVGLKTTEKNKINFLTYWCTHLSLTHKVSAAKFDHFLRNVLILNRELLCSSRVGITNCSRMSSN